MQSRHFALFTCVVALASAGCATSQQPDVPTPSWPVANQITVEAWVWGNKIESWTIDRRTNLVSLTVMPAIPRDPENPEPPKTSTYQKPHGYFEKVWARLSSVVEPALEGVACESPLPTDQGNIIVRWGSDSGQTEFNLYLGCYSPVTRSITQAIDEIRGGLGTPSGS